MFFDLIGRVAKACSVTTRSVELVRIRPRSKLMTQAASTSSLPADVRITAAPVAGQAEVLTPEAVRFVSDLARSFAPRVSELIERRRAVQARLDRGERFDFLPETRAVRESSFQG